MDVKDKVVVVTGGAGGIGSALARRFAGEGARAVVVSDLDGDGATGVAAELDHGVGVAVAANVAVEADVINLVARAESECGPIDLFCANAGIAVGGGPEATDEQWLASWQINLMAHVYAARALLPGWLSRGEGYFLSTASAAGLLTNLGAAPYAVTKHGAVALAEWLAIMYGDAGVKVSCLCPQGVRTNMLFGGAVDDAVGVAVVTAAGRVIEPDEVADAVVAGLRDERFLILTHPEVADYEARRATERDRWLAGMRKLLARLQAGR
ncbi:MAG: oxidoreductase short chain dehydrogenase/reductase family [Acidimicrobiales bacterium]|nr:oxidoreductase short chain dehydrogenase/reductase family [Acidimicrobiales bacterium]